MKRGRLAEPGMIARAVWDSESLVGTSREYEKGWAAACRYIAQELDAWANEQTRAASLEQEET